MSQSFTIDSTIALNNGQQIPRFGLGTWRSDKGLVQAAVEEALRVGYRHIDCAWIYGNEEEVGNGIKAAIEKGYIKRSELFVTSKIWNTHHHASGVQKSVNETLKALQLEYIDLILIHWPTSWSNKYDNWALNPESKQREHESVSRQETWQALESLVDAGKIRSLGVSNFSSTEIDEILAFAKYKPVTNQVEAHPYWQQQELETYLKSKNITLTAYCPLGNLKRPGSEDVTPLNDPFIKSLATKYNKTEAQIIIRWHLQKDFIVIPKTTTLARLPENANVFDFQLSADEMNEFTKLPQQRYVNPDFRPDGKTVF